MSTLITQTGKKSKTAIKNFMGPKGRGPIKTNTQDYNRDICFNENYKAIYS